MKSVHVFLSMIFGFVIPLDLIAQVAQHPMPLHPISRWYLTATEDTVITMANDWVSLSQDSKKRPKTQAQKTAMALTQTLYLRGHGHIQHLATQEHNRLQHLIQATPALTPSDLQQQLQILAKELNVILETKAELWTATQENRFSEIVERTLALIVRSTERSNFANRLMRSSIPTSDREFSDSLALNLYIIGIGGSLMFANPESFWTVAILAFLAGMSPEPFKILFAYLASRLRDAAAVYITLSPAFRSFLRELKIPAHPQAQKARGFFSHYLQLRRKALLNVTTPDPAVATLGIDYLFLPITPPCQKTH